MEEDPFDARCNSIESPTNDRRWNDRYQNGHGFSPNFTLVPDIAHAEDSSPSRNINFDNDRVKEIINPLAYTDGALRFYKLLLHAEKKAGESEKGNANEVPKHAAPDTNTTELTQPFEMVYQKPANRVLVPKNLYPTSDGKEEKYEIIATKMLPHTRSDKDFQDCIEFLKQTKMAITKMINSKISFHFMTEIKKEDVCYQGKPAADIKAVVAAFRHELTEELCYKLLRVYWGSVETNQFMDKLEYQIMSESNLWYCTKEGDLNCCPKSKKRLIGFVRSHIANQIRSNFRKRFQRETPSTAKFKSTMEIWHGVKLCVSKKGGRTKRRVKGVFDRNCLVGWLSIQHLDWMKDRASNGSKKVARNAPATNMGQTNMNFGHPTAIYAPPAFPLLQHTARAIDNLSPVSCQFMVSNNHQSAKDKSLAGLRPIMQPRGANNDGNARTEVCDPLFADFIPNNGTFVACESMVLAADTTEGNRSKNNEANVAKVRSSFIIPMSAVHHINFDENQNNNSSICLFIKETPYFDREQNQNISAMVSYQAGADVSFSHFLE